MISDRELWACAQQVIRRRGKDAGEHVAAARVTELALVVDDEGVRTWMASVDRIDQLSDYSGKGKRRHWRTAPAGQQGTTGGNRRGISGA